MKTIKKNLFALMLLVSTLSKMNAQSFSIKGLFCDKHENAVSATYTLKTGNNNTVSSGRGKKIKIQLELNQNYSLTVTKNGYQSKTIYFSTYTDTKDNFRFRFVILLQEVNNLSTVSNKIAGNVFYDLETKNFDYEAY